MTKKSKEESPPPKIVRCDPDDVGITYPYDKQVYVVDKPGHELHGQTVLIKDEEAQLLFVANKPIVDFVYMASDTWGIYWVHEAADLIG